MSEPKDKRPVIDQGDEGNLYVHDISQDSHDTVNNHTINRNSTVVYHGEAAREKLYEEKVEEYRSFCKRVITSQLIDRDLKLRLKEKAQTLALDEEEADRIEECVKDSLSSSVLSRQDLITLELAKEGILNNDVAPVVNRIVALADSNQAPEVQYYANLILAVTDPRKCILRYERSKFDSYWQMYWVYLAYLRQRNPEKAEKVRNKLNGDLSMNEDFLCLLNGAGCLIEYFGENGADSYKKTALKYLSYYNLNEPILGGFEKALKYVESQSRPLYFTDKPELNFYLNIFGAKKKPQQPSKSIATNPTKAHSESLMDSSRPYSAPHVNSEQPRVDRQPKVNQQQQVNQRSQNNPLPVNDAGNRQQYTPTPSTSDSGKNWKKPVCYLLAVGLIIFIGVKIFSPSSKKEQLGIDNEPGFEGGTEVVTEGPVTEGPVTNGPVTEITTPTEVKDPVPENDKLKKDGTSQKTSVGSGDKTKGDSGPQISNDPQGYTSTGGYTQENPKPENPKPENPKPENPIDKMTVDELFSKAKSHRDKLEYNDALKYFELAAKKGSVEANYELGNLYYNGNGVNQNYRTAKSYYEKAAQAGNANAQYRLGDIYYYGRGEIDRDKTQAKFWLEEAVKQGHTTAKSLLKELNRNN